MTRVQLLDPQRWSMQAHLIAFVIAITLLAWIAGGFVTASNGQREVQALHDRELSHIADLLLGLSGHELQEMASATTLLARASNGHSDADATLGNDYRYQVWSRQGQLLLTNHDSAQPLAPAGRGGYAWVGVGAERWRVYSLRARDSDLEIQVAERADLRNWSFARVDAAYAAFVVASFGAVLLPALWLLRRLLRPLRALALALQERTPANLEPVRIKAVPAELLPIVAAINRLFGRVADTIRREHGFTALAAHELRTPLATLRVLAQAVGQAGSDAERNESARELIQCADRCSHLQEQLLTLSRVDAITAADMNTRIDMTEVVMDTLADMLAAARRRHIRLATELDGSVLAGHRFGVLTLLRNLLGNAVQYTPPHGRVAITTQTEGANVTLHVDDSGEGIPAPERERVFERFERLHRERASGVGLGLSIVRTVADAHGATVTLHDSPLGGLRVSVTFIGRALERPLGAADAPAVPAADAQECAIVTTPAPT